MDEIKRLRKLAGIITEGEVIQFPGNKQAEPTPVSAPQRVSLASVFGNADYSSITELLGRSIFVEKPGYFSDIDRTVTQQEIARIQQSIGQKLKIYNINQLLQNRGGEYYPQSTPKIPMSELDPTFLVKDQNTYYLANTTGARSYIRMWSKVK